MNPALQENNYLHTPDFISVVRAGELAREFLELERMRIREEIQAMSRQGGSISVQK